MYDSIARTNDAPETEWNAPGPWDRDGVDGSRFRFTNGPTRTYRNDGEEIDVHMERYQHTDPEGVTFEERHVRVGMVSLTPAQARDLGELLIALSEAVVL